MSDGRKKAGSRRLKPLGLTPPEEDPAIKARDDAYRRACDHVLAVLRSWAREHFKDPVPAISEWPVGRPIRSNDDAEVWMMLVAGIDATGVEEPPAPSPYYLGSDIRGLWGVRAEDAVGIFVAFRRSVPTPKSGESIADFGLRVLSERVALRVEEPTEPTGGTDGAEVVVRSRYRPPPPSGYIYLADARRKYDIPRSTANFWAQRMEIEGDSRIIEDAGNQRVVRESVFRKRVKDRKSRSR